MNEVWWKELPRYCGSIRISYSKSRPDYKLPIGISEFFSKAYLFSEKNLLVIQIINPLREDREIVMKEDKIPLEDIHYLEIITAYEKKVICDLTLNSRQSQ